MHLCRNAHLRGLTRKISSASWEKSLSRDTTTEGLSGDGPSGRQRQEEDSAFQQKVAAHRYEGSTQGTEGNSDWKGSCQSTRQVEERV
jgi:hypothetical protein